MNSSGSNDIIERAREAWQRHRQGSAWADWMLIGDALILGRDFAMQEAEAKRPEGRRYNTEMAKWLARHGFDNMDNGDRSRLMECMADREAIEKWRETLTATQKLFCNYPRTVLKRWKSATGRTKKPKKKKQGKTLREICSELDAENHRLKQQLAQLPEENRQLKKENAALKAENARLLKQLWPDDWSGIALKEKEPVN